MDMEGDYHMMPEKKGMKAKRKKGARASTQSGKPLALAEVLKQMMQMASPSDMPMLNKASGGGGVPPLSPSAGRRRIIPPFQSTRKSKRKK